jgi:hypothetical protein
MRSKPSIWTITVTVLTFLISSAAHSQMPEGPQVPNPDSKKNATHSLVRIGYYAQTSKYLYHGDYNLTTNAFQIGTADFYGFADVDVEALDERGNFQPNRLAGTFEIGARVPIDNSPVGVFYRHESTHNIDLAGRRQPSWEQLGLRYQYVRPNYDISISAADYDHHGNCFYNADFDLQGTYRIENRWHNPLSIYGDVHAVSEDGGPRSGFTDYWIEPNLGLTKSSGVYIGYGSTHDVDMANGKSSTSVIIGLKWSV